MAKNKQDSKGDKAGKGAKGGKGGKKGADDSGETKSTGKLKGGQSINVRHILCEKFAKSEEAIERLRNGDKFDVVAREMSEDKANKGGALGWQTKGSLDPDFEKVAFELPPSPVTCPTFERVKTGFGYHIIMVEDRK
ncbi:FKBP-like protein [Trichocladium antarcticum]|uniref:Peptidyl-prolyl cis-trans isomerase n=1 Tax=Trichocladium antarcticum TaxID=1450529 RepID=A0AAN6USV6_9PEZI|nr:FKBP-like protein [Trichocladium antarcticum]